MKFKLSEILDESIFTSPMETNGMGKELLFDNLERYKTIINYMKPDNPVSIRLVQHTFELISLCNDIQTVLRMKNDLENNGLLAAFDRNWEFLNSLLTGNTQFRISQTLYRCRKLNLKEIDQELGVKDIYHKALSPGGSGQKEGRYNGEGSSCLYLGSSLLCCWKEIRNQDDPPDPRDANVIASRFFINKHLLWKVLDLSIDYQRLTDGIAQVLSPNYFNQIFTNDTIYKYISFYPIMLAMSLHEEYSISQLFINWVRSRTKIDLVIYTSTHFYNKLNDYSHVKNYAFMIREVNSTGYDERLKSIAKTSRPILLKSISTQQNPPYEESDFLSVLSNDKVFSTSYFTECETYLQKVPIENDW